MLAQRAAIEAELTGAAGEREAALSVSYELRSRAARLAVQRESAQRLIAAAVARSWRRPRQDAARGGPSPEELEREALYARAAAREAAHERDTLAERALTAQERLATLERSLAEREGIPPAARALAEQGERLALSLLGVEPGTERAVAAALGARASALVAADPKAALALLERAAAAGLGSLRVLAGRDSAELVAELPVVEKHELLASKVPAVTRDGYGYDPQRGELWFAGETAEAVLLELEARRARARRGGEAARPSRRRSRSAPRRSPRRTRPRPRPRSPRSRRGCASAAPTSARCKSLLAAAGRLERALEALDAASTSSRRRCARAARRAPSAPPRSARTLRELGEAGGALRRELAAAVDGAVRGGARSRAARRRAATSSRRGRRRALRVEARTLVA